MLTAGEKIHRRTHMGDVKMEAEMEVMWPWVMERKDAKSHQKPEEAAKTSPKSVQRQCSILTLVSGLQKCGRIHHVVLNPPIVVS